MWLVAVAWLYVVLMMALAEAMGSTGDNGSVLGAIVTFVFYGLLPLSILMYILGTPARKRRLHAAAMAERAAEKSQKASSGDFLPAPAASENSAAVYPDRGSHTTTAAEPGSISAMREKP